MIGKLTIHNPSNLPLSWWKKSEALKDIKEITFTKGLNVLWGKNGSGKSSVLTLIAKMFHAEQGRYSLISTESMRKVFEFNKENKDIDDVLKSVSIEHDGQGIHYYDPNHKVGLIGGLAGFDDEFFAEGVQSIFTKGSSGELIMHNLAETLKNFKKNKTNRILPEYKISGNRVEKVKQFFKSSIPDGQSTIILDEPDRSIDIPNQLLLWNIIKDMSSQLQIIVASHSVFGATVNGANYIEFSKDYLNQCRKTILALKGE